jgi:hypothetical protein
MKKNLLLTTLLSILIAQISIAQVKIEAPIAAADNAAMNSFTKEDQLFRVLDPRSAKNVQTFDNRYEGVKGTPFVFDDWSNGTIILKDSSKVTDQLLYKFDLTLNELWVKLPTGQQRILYNSEFLAFELYRPDGKKYIFKKVKLPESVNNNHFAHILFEGKNVTLVKNTKKVFRKSNLEDKGLVTVGNAYDWFEEQHEYFIKMNGKSTEKIKLKKGDIMEKWPKSLEKQIEQYCKSNDIGGKLTDEEAIKLIEYLDKYK